MEPENRVGNWVLDLFQIFFFFFGQKHQGLKNQLTNGIYLCERYNSGRKT